jgi:hypothetical protein
VYVVTAALVNGDGDVVPFVSHGGDVVVVGDDVYANTLILWAMTSLHNGQSLRSSCDEQLLHRHRCRHGSSTTLLSTS